MTAEKFKLLYVQRVREWEIHTEMMILTDEGWMERGVMSRTLLKRHGAKMLEHFTNIWNAITHKSFWDCKLKISCVERDSKYFERDLNILISSASVSYFFLLLVVSDIAAIFLVQFILAVVKMHKNLNFIPQPANSINTLSFSQKKGGCRT